MRPQDPELAELLNKFVPVRITDFKNVDMNRFRFDYDLTFAALMMAPDGYTYSRFGSRDAEHATERMSIPGLKRALKQVLVLHAKHTPAPPPAREPLTLANLRTYAASPAANQKCAHCHFAKNYGFLDLVAKGEFKKSMLFEYPLPENIGVTLELDQNNRVQAVLPDSPAAKAGVRAGDEITQAEKTPVLTAADLQFALNGVPDAGKLTLTLNRGDKPVRVALQLGEGWRKTDISWRAGQGSIPPIVGFWEQPLDEPAKQKLGLPAGSLALKVNFLFPGEKWAKNRGDVRLNDIIVGVDGKQLPAMLPRQLHSYIRLNHEVGDTMTLNVIRGGQRMDVTLVCADGRAD